LYLNNNLYDKLEEKGHNAKLKYGNQNSYIGVKPVGPSPIPNKMKRDTKSVKKKMHVSIGSSTNILGYQNFG